MSERVREGPWTKAQTIIAGLGLILALGTGLLSWVSCGPGARSPAPPSNVDAAGDTRGPAPQVDRATPGECVDADGAPVGCAESASRLVLDVEECTVEAARAALAVPPDIRLDVRVALVADGCVIGPGDLALAHGVSADDIRSISAGALVSALVECAAEDGTPVSCATPHRLEPVTDWAPSTADDEAECVIAVRSYTGRARGPGDPLVAELQRGTSEGREVSRCVVRSANDTLDGSVYRLGGRDLPRISG